MSLDGDGDDVGGFDDADLFAAESLTGDTARLDDGESGGFLPEPAPVETPIQSRFADSDLTDDVFANIDESALIQTAAAASSSSSSAALICVECGAFSYNIAFHSAFGVAVCNECQRDDGGRGAYKLVTKTAAKTQFLLTDADMSSLPFLLRPNPKLKALSDERRRHSALRPFARAKPQQPTSSSSWANMKLYRWSDVESVVVSKFGSVSAAEDEKQRRSVRALDMTLARKRKAETREENRKAKIEKISKSADAKIDKHKHKFRRNVSSGFDECAICGIQTTIEEL